MVKKSEWSEESRKKFTQLNTLPVNTRFYVKEGAWHGEIVISNGKKAVYVEETDRVFDIDDSYELIIEIIEYKTE